MILGIGSYTFPWAVGVPGYNVAEMLSAAGILDIAFSNNIHVVQFGDNMPLGQLSPVSLLELKQHADELSIRIEVGTRGLIANNILRYINIAEAVQSPFVRMIIDDTSFKPGITQVVETIRMVLPVLRDKGIQLAIENHDRFTVGALKQVILDTDPGCVAICLDTANSIGAGEGFHETVSLLAPYTINLHLKDIIIERVPHKMGFTVQGIAAGDGLLDIPWIIARLKPYGKCKTAILELWPNLEATMSETLLKETEMAAKSIKYLKGILL